MGLFSKKSKNNNAGTFLPPQQFYTLCMKDYHDFAQKQGYAVRGVIFIPELVQYGQQLVLNLYRNEALQRNFSTPQAYYCMLVETAIRSGIICGLKWHLDFPGLNQSGYMETVLGHCKELSAEAIKSDLQMSEKKFVEFSKKVYEHWSELHEPYWSLSDPRNYTFFATVAAFQLGVSMILCKYGF